MSVSVSQLSPVAAALGNAPSKNGMVKPTSLSLDGGLGNLHDNCLQNLTMPYINFHGQLSKSFEADDQSSPFRLFSLCYFNSHEDNIE